MWKYFVIYSDFPFSGWKKSVNTNVQQASPQELRLNPSRWISLGCICATTLPIFKCYFGCLSQGLSVSHPGPCDSGFRRHPDTPRGVGIPIWGALWANMAQGMHSPQKVTRYKCKGRQCPYLDLHVLAYLSTLITLGNSLHSSYLQTSVSSQALTLTELPENWSWQHLTRSLSRQGNPCKVKWGWLLHLVSNENFMFSMWLQWREGSVVAQVQPRPRQCFGFKVCYGNQTCTRY